MINKQKQEFTDEPRKCGEIKLYKHGNGKGFGFGFIIPDDGTDDIFFHFTRLQKDVDPNLLQAGMRVTFYTVQRPNGLHAVDIALEEK